MDGEKNDLIDRIAADKAFGLTQQDLERLLDPAQFTGRAKEQTEEFLVQLGEVLQANRSFLGAGAEIKV